MGTVIRGALIVIGIVFMLGGLGVIVSFPEAAPSGLWGVATGAFLVVIPLLERQRYRSEAAEKARETPGPGGGESAGDTLEARFRPTAEVFVDPTTGHRMRVLVDPGTGERRYVAEG